MDKVLLAEMKKPIRGVELFNTNFIKDLSDIGYHITLPLHESWIEYLSRNNINATENVRVVSCSLGNSSLCNGLSAVWKLRKEHFSVFLLANVAKSLMPTMSLARRMNIVDKFVLVAHREPTNRFVRICRKIKNMAIVSVNDKIAAHFDKKDFSDVKTYYGITNAEKFFPVKSADSNQLPFKFCVLGKLDNAWKGADTAVEAFLKLPLEKRKNCELHLASFSDKPVYEDKNIIPYDWIKASEIPEFLRKMDAMIVPSRDEEVMRETFSQAMVQGMLTGLPICCNDLPILNEKVDIGGGFIFKDVDSLADYMQHLSENRQLAESMGKTARKIAEERYVWSSKRFVDLFV